MEQYEMPVGFEMALARNFDAMQKFENLSETQKQDILEGTHSVQSKEKMRRYVNSIVEKY